MLAKRLPGVVSVLVFCFFTSTCCWAQKADVSLTVGGTFASDSNVDFVLICPVAPPQTCPNIAGTIQSGHHVYIAGTPAVQLISVKLVALYLEVPIAGIPTHNLKFVPFPSINSGSVTTTFGNMSSLFVTPAFRLKVLPGAPISPFASVGGGLARYSLGNGSTNRGALQYGGGVDFKTGIPLLGFRAEVRDFVSGDPSWGQALGPFFAPNTIKEGGLHRHNVLAGGGVVLRF
jgi:hypothetical protein